MITTILLLLADLNGASQIKSIAICQEMWKLIAGDPHRYDLSLSNKNHHFSEIVRRDEELETPFDFPSKAAMERFIGFDLRAAVLTNYLDDAAILPRKKVEHVSLHRQTEIRSSGYPIKEINMRPANALLVKLIDVCKWLMICIGYRGELAIMKVSCRKTWLVFKNYSSAYRTNVFL
ncbi:hypothetical protein BKA65DRAFT_184554 [Rhexocercosporidium sp. MPI-PUGE-AT-0058]|nr:hypothetical protein BKA65DRAFT_184554 [Rhexocercosporidium sp. MPI-PUGE-AT-0058]